MGLRLTGRPHKPRASVSAYRLTRAGTDSTHTKTIKTSKIQDIFSSNNSPNCSLQLKITSSTHTPQNHTDSNKNNDTSDEPILAYYDEQWLRNTAEVLPYVKCFLCYEVGLAIRTRFLSISYLLCVNSAQRSRLV